MRAEAFVGGYAIKNLGDNKCKVTYISDADPKGSIPQIIKNQAAKDQASVPDNLQ